DVSAIKTLRKSATLVTDSADGNVFAPIATIGHMPEVTIGMRIMQLAMFAESLQIICPLDLMLHLVLEIGAGKNLAIFVEIQPPRISPALGEQFEIMGYRMVSPNPLLKFCPA